MSHYTLHPIFSCWWTSIFFSYHHTLTFHSPFFDRSKREHLHPLEICTKSVQVWGMISSIIVASRLYCFSCDGWQQCIWWLCERATDNYTLRGTRGARGWFCIHMWCDMWHVCLRYPKESFLMRQYLITLFTPRDRSMMRAASQFVILIILGGGGLLDRQTARKHI